MQTGLASVDDTPGAVEEEQGTLTAADAACQDQLRRTQLACSTQSAGAVGPVGPVESLEGGVQEGSMEPFSGPGKAPTLLGLGHAEEALGPSLDKVRLIKGTEYIQITLSEGQSLDSAPPEEKEQTVRSVEEGLSLESEDLNASADSSESLNSFHGPDENMQGRVMDRDMRNTMSLQEEAALGKLRRVKNFIPTVRVGDRMYTEQEDKEKAFFQAYLLLFGNAAVREYTIDPESVGLQARDLQGLDVLFSEEEVWRVIQDLPADRAPGPDGFIGLFYQKAWSFIKGDIMAALLKLAVGDGRGFDKLNRSIIVLIPKKPYAIEVGDFRPISLVHSFGKLFSKLVASRLRGRLGELVSENQSAFVKGRCLHDNFLLVRQLARKISTRKVKGVFLKLDKSRAFDSFSWPFLFEVLRKLGFGERCLKWFALLLYTASVKILVNGVARKSIKIVRGLRQGDPTSPQLFVLAMEALTMCIVKASEEGLLTPLVGCVPKQRVSIYAEDVAIFLKPQVQEIVAVREVLQFFCEASGLRVNYRKTAAVIIRGDVVDSLTVKHLLHCETGSFPAST
ncbi:hypothetical protein ACQ4PT_067560 [Festuca glaucescens]